MRALGVGTLAAALCATACASQLLLDPQLSTADVAAARTSTFGSEVLARFRENRARVRRVSYQLVSRGARLCGDFRLPDAGMLLGTKDSFRSFLGGSDLQDIANQAYELEDGITVLYVVPDSVLAAHDVRAGDVLAEVGGQKVATLEELNERLFELREQPVPFVFTRGGRAMAVEAQLPLVCGVPVNYSGDFGLMTFQDGNTVAVPYGMIDAAASDDELGIAIAHQIAHVLVGFASEPVPDPEATADRVGLLLAAEAGFDVSGAPAFWERLASEDPWRIPDSKGFQTERPSAFLEGGRNLYPTLQLHVGIGRRMPAIRATVQEIVASSRR